MPSLGVANVIKLHRQGGEPLKFSSATLRALGALAFSMPGISVDFAVDEGGDAYAVVSRRRGQLALVIAGTAGTTSIVDQTGATAATLGDDEAGIRWALRCAVESGGNPWET